MAQTTEDNCTHLNFSIYSPYPFENLTLYADGPCRNTNKSQTKLLIIFLECTCPVGFQPKSSVDKIKCMCDCDPQLLQYAMTCNLQDKTLTRNGNFWISYLNVTTDPHKYSYLTYPYCPLDYCMPPDAHVKINLSTVNGSDMQCANNRSGILCGVCQPGLSLSLGSSRCISCEGLKNMLVILAGSFLAGLALVVTLLILNLTVAVGTLNGLILYANIIGAVSSTFFPSPSTKVPHVIVSWLNLELGFDACFFTGMDAYIKTWLQMAFPTYIIFLLIIVIKLSEHFIKFARLIGKWNPVATLATLILLSYAKFLSTVITALSFISLDFPNGSHKKVWLPDASIGYFSGRHIALVTVAIIIVFIGSIYTLFLLFWQWLLKWVTNQKLCYFFEVYHALTSLNTDIGMACFYLHILFFTFYLHLIHQVILE